MRKEKKYRERREEKREEKKDVYVLKEGKRSRSLLLLHGGGAAICSSPMEEEQILNIPISNSDVDDGWRWRFDPKGNFTVKGCYRAICGEFMGHQNDIWSKIWQLRIPLHVRNFLRRVCKNFLPTAETLAQRKVYVYSHCSVCSADVDNALHLLVLYRMAEACWKTVNTPVLHDEMIVVDCMFSWLSEMEMEEKTSWHGRVTWLPPYEGWLNANYDAACFSNNHGTCLGMMVRDYMGNTVQARLVRVHGNVSPRMAEEMSILEALSWLKGYSNLIIELDAMEVILEIRNPELSEDILFGYCAIMAHQFSNIIFTFVRQSANQAAHIMTQNAHSISDH
ncbi:uncharacterized protein LOC126687914 [Mercurialis annua]|uniref:uncharacterized protein LOC126687914 n=1 Tax=Mercurialis annua TaxID=3986 RepID=UPI0021605FA8|nr:uncharacterized protein LOC126687914 [Mercurialis annua]